MDPFGRENRDGDDEDEERPRGTPERAVARHEAEENRVDRPRVAERQADREQREGGQGGELALPDHGGQESESHGESARVVAGELPVRGRAEVAPEVRHTPHVRRQERHDPAEIGPRVAGGELVAHARVARRQGEVPEGRDELRRSDAPREAQARDDGAPDPDRAAGARDHVRERERADEGDERQGAGQTHEAEGQPRDQDPAPHASAENVVEADQEDRDQRDRLLEREVPDAFDREGAERVGDRPEGRGGEDEPALAKERQHGDAPRELVRHDRPGHPARRAEDQEERVGRIERPVVGYGHERIAAPRARLPVGNLPGGERSQDGHAARPVALAHVVRMVDAASEERLGVQEAERRGEHHDDQEHRAPLPRLARGRHAAPDRNARRTETPARPAPKSRTTRSREPTGVPARSSAHQSIRSVAQ